MERSTLEESSQNLLSNADQIPLDLLEFLEGNVASVEQLEILRVVGESSGDVELARLTAEAQATPAAVAALQERGLLTIRTVGSVSVCGFSPMPAETLGLLRRLLQLYKERPVTLIKMTYASDHRNLKAFADAFRLRKDG